MLLNQCLAISFSPARAPPGGSNRPTGDETPRPVASGADPAGPVIVQAINQANALKLYEQFVQHNSHLKSTDDEHQENSTQVLSNVFKRLEFAGFVVPSWLLLSGTFDDLCQLRSSWTSGHLHPPAGLRIETIGNIRSVNVDYLGEQQQRQSSMEDDELAGRRQAEAAPLQLNERHRKRVASISSPGQVFTSLNTHQDARIRETSLFEGPRRARVNQHFYHHQATSPTGESAASKSATLDSGIQATWTERSASGGGNSSSASPSALSSNSSCEDHEQPQIMPLVIVEKSPALTSSILSARPALHSRGRSLSARRPAIEMVQQQRKLADANTCDPDQLEQVIIEDNQQVAAVRKQPHEQSSGGARRRGFSLTRSFSFHKQPPAPHSSRAPQVESVAQQRQQATTTREQTIANNQRTNGLAAGNLSSLFRSKSMRVVGGGGCQALRQNCDNDQAAASRVDGRGRRPSRLTAEASERQATIDYLASAQHKRSFSMRRNSLLAFGKEELGGGAGKIALFLRKLFSLRRSSRRARHLEAMAAASSDDERDQEQDGVEGHLSARDNDILHLELCRRPHEGNNNCDQCANSCNKNGSTEWLAATAGGGNAQTKLTNQLNSFVNLSHNSHHHLYNHHHHHHHANSPTNADGKSPRRAQDDSPPSSPLEVGDCSPALEDSRRHLRQEGAVNASANRASWHLLKRSESSLSQQSNASASTNKSTVSQQLRKHLDEVYKRHRAEARASTTSSSKQEREFIDSINVLRQASRHASLENSRSSSKNRQVSSSKARPWSSSKSNSPPALATTSTSAAEDDSSNCSITSEHLADNRPIHLVLDSEDQLELEDELEDDVRLSQIVKQAQHAQTQPDLITASWQPEQNKCAQLQLPPAPQLNCGWCLYSGPPPLIGMPQVAHQAHELCSQLACCPVAQQAASNTQLACCSLGHSQSGAAMAHRERRQSIALNNNSDQDPNRAPDAPETPSSSGGGDLCCPIWRSIIYSYCQAQAQQQQLALSAPFNVIAAPHSPRPQVQAPPLLAGGNQLPSVIDHQQQAQLLLPPPPAAFLSSGALPPLPPPPSLARSGHTFSASSLTNLQQQQQHQQQQQQHNTTIDLKIEIGADFKKKLMASSGSGNCKTGASQRAKGRQQATIAQTSSSSAITSDSLDSSDSVSHDDEDDEEDERITTASDDSARVASSSSSKVMDGNQIIIKANLRGETEAPLSSADSLCNLSPVRLSVQPQAAQ